MVLAAKEGSGLFQIKHGVQREAHKIVLKLCRLGQCA